MKSIKLLSGAPCSIRMSSVDGFMVANGGFDNLPKKLYNVLVGGKWLTLADEAEYDRVRQLAAEAK